MENPTSRNPWAFSDSRLRWQSLVMCKFEVTAIWGNEQKIALSDTGASHIFGNNCLGKWKCREPPCKPGNTWIFRTLHLIPTKSSDIALDPINIRSHVGEANYGTSWSIWLWCLWITWCSKHTLTMVATADLVYVGVESVDSQPNQVPKRIPKCEDPGVLVAQTASLLPPPKFPKLILWSVASFQGWGWGEPVTQPAALHLTSCKHIQHRYSCIFWHCQEYFPDTMQNGAQIALIYIYIYMLLAALSWQHLGHDKCWWQHLGHEAPEGGKEVDVVSGATCHARPRRETKGSSFRWFCLLHIPVCGSLNRGVRAKVSTQVLWTASISRPIVTQAPVSRQALSIRNNAQKWCEGIITDITSSLSFVLSHFCYVFLLSFFPSIASRLMSSTRNDAGDAAHQDRAGRRMWEQDRKREGAREELDRGSWQYSSKQRICKDNHCQASPDMMRKKPQKVVDAIMAASASDIQIEKQHFSETTPDNFWLEDCSHKITPGKVGDSFLPTIWSKRHCYHEVFVDVIAPPTPWACQQTGIVIKMRDLLKLRGNQYFDQGPFYEGGQMVRILALLSPYSGFLSHWRSWRPFLSK